MDTSDAQSSRYPATLTLPVAGVQQLVLANGHHVYLKDLDGLFDKIPFNDDLPLGLWIDSVDCPQFRMRYMHLAEAVRFLDTQKSRMPDAMKIVHAQLAALLDYVDAYRRRFVLRDWNMASDEHAGGLDLGKVIEKLDATYAMYRQFMAANQAKAV